MATRAVRFAATIPLLLTIAGCAGATRRYAIIHRGPLESTFSASAKETLARDYGVEYRYVQARRDTFDFSSANVRDDLVGLALSGGGIRSATFGLGVLQGLQEIDVSSSSKGAPTRSLLSRVDYLSGTSGGAYITGWLQAHYGSSFEGSPKQPVNALGWEVVADSERRLLSEDGKGESARTPNDHLSQLRQHAGFLNDGGFWPALGMINAYLVRLPVAFLLDVALHLKGNFNWQHMSDVYRVRIGDTYLHDREELRIDEMNSNGHLTPYVVINGTLTNFNLHEKPPFKKHGYPFEFTRDYTGSDGLGYVETPAFDQRVASVEWSNEADWRDRQAKFVTIFGTGAPTSSLSTAWAIAASGAAFDPDGALSRKNSVVRSIGGYVGSALNLAIGYETWNYARSFDGWWTPVDYLRMLSYQRVAPFIERRARWIKITDGGHFDNSSVFALLRRGVQTIISAEAGADPKLTYGDRLRLKELAEGFFDIDVEHEKTWLRDEICLRRNGRAVARVIFVKPSATFCESPETPRTRDEAKICGYHRFDPTYPQTTTMRQWYDLETFEAYRLLGRKMARERFDPPRDFPPLAVACPVGSRH